MVARIALYRAQRNLLLLWAAAAAAIAVLFIAQTLGGAYEGYEQEAWGWLLPNVMPVLSLMVGVLVRGAREFDDASTQVRRLVFELARGLSAFYLLVMLATLLLQPVIGRDPLATLYLSNLWLGPLQGLTAAAIGAFFVDREASARKAAVDE